MSRSGYSDGLESCELNMWRGAVHRATIGKRGQAFFRELVAALDAMPVKRLVAGELQTTDGEVCALGSLAKRKGAALKPNDTYDHGKLGETFNIARALAQETMYENDEGGPWRREPETPEERWTRVRKWAADQIRVTPAEHTLEHPNG
jgi:hypothetical protein